MAKPSIEVIQPDDDAGIEIDLDNSDIEVDTETKPVSKVTDDDILALKRDLDAAKAAQKKAQSTVQAAETRRVEAETRARETENKLSGEVETRLKAQEDTIVAGISSAEGEIKAIRGNLAQLQAEGKWTEAAEAMESLSDAQIRLREFRSQKAGVDNLRTQLKDAPKRQGPEVSSKTQAWIAAHPKFTTDRRYNAKAMWLHEDALAEGFAVDSDEYFKHIEIGLGEREADPVSDDGGEGDYTPEPVKVEIKSRPQSKKIETAAPVTRRTEATTKSANPNKVVLSRDEVDQANNLFGDPGSILYIENEKDRLTYWARNRDRLKAEGRIT